MTFPDALSQKAYDNPKERDSWFRKRAKILELCLYKSLLQNSKRPEVVYLLMDAGDKSRYEKYFSGLSNMVVPVF